MPQSRPYPHPPHALPATALFVLLVLLALASACAGDANTDADAGGTGADSGPLMFTDALTMGETVPAAHKCPMSVLGDGMGDNRSPALSWRGGPRDTGSFALVLRDTRWHSFHWALWDIPADVRALPEGIPAGEAVTDPPGARQMSMASDGGYFGPCSDAGALAGVYEYRLYALDVAELEVAADADSETLLQAIEAASLASIAWEADPD